MSVKDEVLVRLLDKEGAVVSGQALSEELLCSRMSVSKAVKELGAEGYEIEAVKGTGYILRPNDLLTQAVVSHDFSVPAYFYEETGSTMQEAKALIAQGVEAPFVCVAGRQTGGRGRLGRSFYSPEGGIYFSIVVDGRQVPSPDLLTISASLAVANALEASTGRKADIKWVNDVYVDGLKVTGILTEGIVNMELGGLDKAIVGIGINLSGDSSKIPQELQGKMGILYPTGQSPVSRSRLAAAVTDGLLSLQGKSFMDDYRRRCFIIGRDITAHKAGRSREAHAYGVDDNGHLLVRYKDGTEEALYSGEVTLTF